MRNSAATSFTCSLSPLRTKLLSAFTMMASLTPSRCELYLGDVNGTTPVALTNTSRSIEMNASVSPDGKKIVYTDYNDGQVYVADLK